MRVIDAFQRRHPDIKVRTLLSGPDALLHASIYCAGGKCPDVLMAWEFTYSGLAERGVLLDLNTMLAHDNAFAAEIKADSVAALYDTFAYNGGQYAFPEQWSGNFLFYNKTLFADAGVPPPPARWDEPWGFGEFLDAAKALTKRDRLGPGDAVGIRRHLGAVLFGPVVRHEQRCPVVESADQPDAPQLRRCRIHRGYSVLRRSGQPAQCRAHRIGGAVDGDNGPVHLGSRGDGARRPLEIPDPRPRRRFGFRHRRPAGRAERTWCSIEYRHHRAGDRGEQSAQKAGVGVREVCCRPGGAGRDQPSQGCSFPC